MTRRGKLSAQRTFIDTFCIYIFICRLFNNAVSAFDYNDDIRNKVTKELLKRDTRWRSRLRHCATSRKVASSIPNGVNDLILPAALRHWGRLSLC